MIFFKKLKESGVLGMNQRLGDFILPHNKRKLYPLVDSKIDTYYLAKKNNIPQPENYFHLTSYGDLKTIERELTELKDFVVKPSHGAMGNGILIVHEVLSEDGIVKSFSTSNGNLSLTNFKHHISNILGGMYSLSGKPDQVIIQEKLFPYEGFIPYSYKGIPDVRVIVFNGYPIMAMIRFPTKQSRGRANLHQGAVGCGIELKDGSICASICQDKRIYIHPDTEADFSNLIIPAWEELLLLAASCYDITKMGYLGVDIVLDNERGPLLLEMNARPGLSIQIANMQGILPRLEKVQTLEPEIMKSSSPASRVKFSMENF